MLCRRSDGCAGRLAYHAAVSAGEQSLVDMEPEVIGIFHDLDPDLWRQVNHNPVALLAALPAEQLVRRAVKRSTARATSSSGSTPKAGSTRATAMSTSSCCRSGARSERVTNLDRGASHRRSEASASPPGARRWGARPSSYSIRTSMETPRGSARSPRSSTAATS